MEDYKKKLSNRGYKCTPQRRAVYDIIMASTGKHLTAEEIYNVVKESYSGIGIATVYRTLQMLEELCLIKKDYIDTGVIRYELNDPQGGHAHHHLVCTSCGSIIEPKEDFMDKIEEIIEKNYGFMVQDHNIKFFGTCKDCVRRNQEEKVHFLE